jgi:ProP effector
MTHHRNMQYAEIAATIALLVERFPKTFFILESRRKPLKLKIHLDLQAAFGGAVTPDELGAALRFYCGNEGYLRSTLKGAWRVDLDGNPASVVTADEQAHAVTHIAARAKAAAARKAAPPSSSVQPSATGWRS